MMRGFTQIAAFARRKAGQLSMPGLAISGAVSVAAVALVYLALEWAAPILPLNTDLYAINRPPAYTFLDEQGEVVGRRGATVGERLSLSEMPAYLPAAFLVMEDRRFYRHDGIDLRGLVRAALADIEAKRFVQGGSTITQQLVKILFLTPDRTLTRKIVELAGARQLERLLTKDQILELYLNRIYLGAGAYGVDGAARTYFGKSAREVTLAEAAMLASLTNAPTRNSPRRDLKAAQQRSARVLRALVTYGSMGENEIAQGLSAPATIVAESQDLERNYFLDTAAAEAKSLAPKATGDLTIVTTLDANMQKAASTAIEDVMKKRGASAQAQQAALVAMRPDGAVRAIMGGRDYAESTFNRVTQAHRSPGSAFKPFVYLTALEKGLTRDTIRYDEPIAIKDWSPDNFDGTNAGAMTLQAALVRSINTVAVGLGQEVGLPSVISTAKRLGIRSPLEPNASLAIGTSEVTPLELTAAYASFASLGFEAAPYTILEIRASDGGVLYQRMPQQPRRVISEDNALAMNAMLFDVVLSGTGRGAAVRGREVAGKTGTSADYRDAWFIGYSPELVAGVWLGNDDFTPMKRVTGGALPAQIWRGFMQAALKGKRPTPLPRAEPIHEPPVIAENQNDNFFDRLGGFFERLFAGEAQARTRGLEPPPPRPSQPNLPNTQPQVSRPEPRADAAPEYARGRYAYQPRNVYPEPRREPQARAEREYARDRDPYQPENLYPPPRRGYGYRDDPRYRPRYGYGYRERRQDADPRYYDRRYRY
jgi:penicillin-binding protein 1A